MKLVVAALASVALLVIAAARLLARGDGATAYERLLSYAFLALILPWLVVLVLVVRPGSATPTRARGAALAEGLSLGGLLAALGLPIGLGLLAQRPPGPQVHAFLLLFCAVQVGALLASRTMRKAAPSRAAFVSGAGLAAVPFMLLAIGQLVSFGHGHTNSEAAAISDLRTVIAAQAAYASVTDGAYGTLQCLSRPWPCIPGYPTDAATFLDPAFLQPVRRGYRFEFKGSARVPGGAVAGFDGYTVTATPVEPGRTGIRLFCGDATGAIRFAARSPMPPVEPGSCPSSMEPLR